MTSAAQLAQIDLNYDVFARMLAEILPRHKNQFALMRDGEVIDYFDRPGDANVAGLQRYADEIFSIQEVTDEPIDLGFWSHVAAH